MPPSVPEERAPASVSKGASAETNADPDGRGRRAGEAEPGGRGGRASDRHETSGPTNDDWQALLRSQGYRLTPQRELVLTAVETLGHATPDEVFAEVRRHSDSINLSTVYRTLELLDELGLIRHAHLTDRAPTYHSARGHEHAHLVCRTCRRSFSVDRAEAEAALRPLVAARGFTPDYGHLTVFGFCEACRAV